MSQTKSDSTQHWSSETVPDWSSRSYLEKLSCHYIAVDSCQAKNMGCCMSIDGFYCCGPKGKLRADLDLINDTIVSSIVRANYVSLFLFILSIILLSVVVCCIIDATHFRWSRKQEIQSAVERKSKNLLETEVFAKGIAVDGQTHLREDKNSSVLNCSGCSATTQGEMSAASWWQHDSNSFQALQTTAQVHPVPPDLLVSNASRENMTAVLPLIGPNKSYMQYPVLYERKHSLPTSSRNIYYTPISVQRNNSFTTISKDKPANVSQFRDNNPSTSYFGSLVEEVSARKKRLPSKSSVDDNTSTTTTTTSTFSRKQLYSFGDLETLV